MCAALYPVIASTCNHSCDPSLVRVTCHGDLVLAAGRHVTRGQELTDIYTVHWTEYTTTQRQEYLEVSEIFFDKNIENIISESLLVQVWVRGLC